MFISYQWKSSFCFNSEIIPGGALIYNVAEWKLQTVHNLSSPKPQMGLAGEHIAAFSSSGNMMFLFTGEDQGKNSEYLTVR